MLLALWGLNFILDIPTKEEIEGGWICEIQLYGSLLGHSIDHTTAMSVVVSMVKCLFSSKNS
jgi:hypothetical protein